MGIREIVHSRTGAVIVGAPVLVTLGGVGGAVAVGQITSSDIKDNSIRSVDIRDQTIQKRDIGRGAVGSSEVINGSLGMRELNGYTRNKIEQGGADGADGADGTNGQDAETQVTSLSGDFTATNGSVSLTPDGVEFGPYANGGTDGGSVQYDGLNGQPLSVVENLVYYARYTATEDSGGLGVPYLRIWTEGDTHSAIFSPNTQPDADVAEGPFHEWVATSGSWRYDDDWGGPGPDPSFSDLVTAHGTETISAITITQGFADGQDLAALLRWMEVNGTFGS